MFLINSPLFKEKFLKNFDFTSGFYKVNMFILNAGVAQVVSVSLEKAGFEIRLPLISKSIHS